MDVIKIAKKHSRYHHATREWLVFDREQVEAFAKAIIAEHEKELERNPSADAKDAERYRMLRARLDEILDYLA